MDLEMVLRVTRAYQLRLFNTHLPEVPFQEQDLQELRLSVGRTNISSVERVRYTLVVVLTWWLVYLRLQTV